MSATLIILLFPLLLARGAYGTVRHGYLFDRERLQGQFREPFERLRFAGSAWGRDLAALVNIFRGDMSWVGPKPTAVEDAPSAVDAEGIRFLQRPGLISLFGLRKQVGIAYEAEDRVERDYFFGEGVRKNLGVITRYVVGSALSTAEHLPAPAEIDFFGVRVANTTMEDALDWVIDRARQPVRTLAAFVNPDCLNIAYRDEAYRSVLTRAAIVLPDGIGLRIGCNVLGVAMKANVNGTDFFPRICARAAEVGLPVFFLGARPGIAELAARNLANQCPGLVVAGTHHGYFSIDEAPEIVRMVNDSGAKLLFVAFGAPRQEMWLARHHDELAPSVRIGVGAALDFYSGSIPRAPQWLREIGFEWAYRLYQEPGRMWRRYVVGNPLFLYRVWLQSKGAQ